MSRTSALDCSSIAEHETCPPGSMGPRATGRPLVGLQSGPVKAYRSGGDWSPVGLAPRAPGEVNRGAG